MQIKETQKEPLRFSIIGRLDTNTSPQLEEYVGKVIDEHWGDVAVDMGECEFVSSAGLRVIVAMQKRTTQIGGKLSFNNVSSEVMDVFAMTGFDKILTLSVAE